MISFVFDTSALLSLEAASLLDTVLKNFTTILSPSVVTELEDFAKHEDELGKVAKRILDKKDKLRIEESSIKQKLGHVSETDNKLFNLASSKNISLITDDIKLTRHSAGKIITEFSTYFLLVFVASGLFTQKEALEKLESMRDLRSWQNNIIYLTTKEQLKNIEK